MLCGKGFIFSRFTVMMSLFVVVVGGKLRFFPGDLAIPVAVFFTIVFAFFVGPSYCNLFYDCSSFGSLGEVFALGGAFPLSFLKGVGSGHRVENYF